MLLVVVLVSLYVLVNSQGGSPTDLKCDNVAISAALWQRQFPTNYAFNGFFQADGILRILDPTGNTVFSLPLSGCVWHQYFSNTGYLVGDLFLPGFFVGSPDPLVLTSRQTSNPMLGQDKVCQNFIFPSPPNLIASYSELVAHGVGYMESKYFSLDPATYKQVFSNEFFNFDSAMQTAFSETNNNLLGVGHAAHYIYQAVNFRYTPINETQAIALGYNQNVAVFNSTRGVTAGRGAIPIEVIPAGHRKRFNL